MAYLDQVREQAQDSVVVEVEAGAEVEAAVVVEVADLEQETVKAVEPGGR